MSWYNASIVKVERESLHVEEDYEKNQKIIIYIYG